MKFPSIPAEKLEKVKACKTPEEVLALAKEEGYELTEEELAQVSGGNHAWVEVVLERKTCPHCGNPDIDINILGAPKYGCPKCGTTWD